MIRGYRNPARRPDLHSRAPIDEPPAIILVSFYENMLLLHDPVRVVQCDANMGTLAISPVLPNKSSNPLRLGQELLEGSLLEFRFAEMQLDRGKSVVGRQIPRRIGSRHRRRHFVRAMRGSDLGGPSRSASHKDRDAGARKYDTQMPWGDANSGRDYSHQVPHAAETRSRTSVSTAALSLVPADVRD